MKRIFRIVILIFTWICLIPVYLFLGYKTGTATNSSISFFAAPFISILFWVMLRKNVHWKWVYPLLIVLFFIPIIPVYFTYLNYSNNFFRNILLAVFVGICGTAFLHKGITNKILILAFLACIALNTSSNYGRYHQYGEEKITELNIDDYSFIYIKYNIMNGDVYETKWKGKKYILGGILYDYASVKEDLADSTSCNKTLIIAYKNRYLIAPPSETITKEYNICSHQIIEGQN